MKDMKHDKEIEERFREYFDGNQTPACDLTYAKKAVLKDRAEKKRRRAVFFRCASALACLVIAITLGAVYLPSLIGGNRDNQPPVAEDPTGPVVYSLSQTTARAVGYEEVRAAYGAETEIFLPFEWADNASLSYTLHEYEKGAVLLCAALQYRGGMQTFEASVYIDLSDGTYTASDFDAYRAQGENEIKTEYLNGEYVSTAYVVSGEKHYYTQVISPQKGAEVFLVNYLKK